MDEDSYIKLCRLCLEKPEEEPSWLTNRNIKDAFREALSDVELNETDRLSQIICRSCMSLIQSIREFKQTIKRNQSFLLTLLQKPELGQFVEVNVTNPEIKEEEIVNEPPNKKGKKRHEEEPLSDQDDTSESDSSCVSSVRDNLSDKDFKPSERDSLSDDEDLAIPDNFSVEDFTILPRDSEIEADTLLRTRSHRQYGELFQCNLCKYSAKSKTEIRGHMEIIHRKKYRQGPNDTFVCCICDHVSLTVSTCKQHLRMHREAEVKPFKCVRCNSNFRTQKGLDVHIDHTHFVENYPYACTLCISARFVSEEVLNSHTKRHEEAQSKSDKKPFACTACELQFSRKSMLDNHLKHHEKNELKSCQVCGLTLHRTYLMNHMDKHKSKYELLKHVCSLCGKRYRHVENLVKHEKLHDSPEHFECDKCGKVLKKKQKFVNHVKQCQGPMSEFPCKFCELMFKSKHAKYRHENRAHRGFKCKRCNVQFERNYGLKVHRRTVEHKQKKSWDKTGAAEVLKAT